MTKKWVNIKVKVQPGPLHSHAACKIPSGMLIFGGERNGQLVDEVWRFSFGKLIILFIDRSDYKLKWYL